MTPLHEIGDYLRELLLRVPMGVVRGLFVLFPAAVLAWVLFLPRSQTTPPKAETRLSENLKIWAAAALVIQILIYWLV